MESKEMTFEEWWDKFRPEKNTFDPNPSGPSMDDYGRLFATSGDEFEYVRSVAKQDPGRVWTLLDCDGVQFIGSGLHFVNREGYFVTEVPLTEPFLEIRVDEDDPEDELDLDEEGDDLEAESSPAVKKFTP